MERYYEIFKELPLPAVLLNKDGEEEAVNDAFLVSFQGKETAKNILRSISGDMQRMLATPDKRVLFEKKLKLGSDDEKYFRIRMTEVSGTGEKYVLVLFTDITERRKQIEEISRLASIVDSSDDAIVSVSLNKKVMSWNHGAEHIYGYRAADIVGSSIMKIVPKSVTQEFESYMSVAAHGDSYSRYETINCHQDGHLFPVSLTISPLRFHEQIIGVTIVARDISSRRQAEQQLMISHRNLKSLMYETVESLSTAHEKRDLYTAGHQRSVSMISCCIADEMNLSFDQVEGIRIAGLLHDIGKVCIPMAILAKPARLSPEEMALMKRHSEAGYEIVKNIPFAWPVKDIVLQHHERIDGSGYPQGLRGEQLLLEAKILAVADVLEAMSAHRPYRPALGLDAALQEVMDGAGVRYDKGVCDVAVKLFDDGVLRLEDGRLVCSM